MMGALLFVVCVDPYVTVEKMIMMRRLIFLIYGLFLSQISMSTLMPCPAVDWLVLDRSFDSKGCLW